MKWVDGLDWNKSSYGVAEFLAMQMAQAINDYRYANY